MLLTLPIRCHLCHSGFQHRRPLCTKQQQLRMLLVDWTMGLALGGLAPPLMEYLLPLPRRQQRRYTAAHRRLQQQQHMCPPSPRRLLESSEQQLSR